MAEELSEDIFDTTYDLTEDHYNLFKDEFIYWVTVYGTEPTEYNIRKCGYHEATELLLSKINDLVRSRNVTDRQIEEEIHRLIRILENTHWESDFERRLNERPTTRKNKPATKRKRAVKKG